MKAYQEQSEYIIKRGIFLEDVTTTTPIIRYVVVTVIDVNEEEETTSKQWVGLGQIRKH
jgi:hypothetical protein